MPPKVPNVDWTKVDPMKLITTVQDPDGRYSQLYSWRCLCGHQGGKPQTSKGKARRGAVGHIASHLRLPAPTSPAVKAPRAVKEKRLHQNVRAMLWAKAHTRHFAIQESWGARRLSQHLLDRLPTQPNDEAIHAALEEEFRFVTALDEALADPTQRWTDIEKQLKIYGPSPLWLAKHAILQFYRSTYEFYCQNSSVLPDPVVVAATTKGPTRAVDYLISTTGGYQFRLPAQATFQDLVEHMMQVVYDDDFTHMYIFEALGHTASVSRRLPDDPSRMIEDHRCGRTDERPPPKYRSDKTKLWQFMPNDNNPYASTQFAFYWDMGSTEVHNLTVQAVDANPLKHGVVRSPRGVIKIEDEVLEA